jgi:hypothetical protein
MNILRRMAFLLGLVLGLVTLVVVGTELLTYLFTGKFPSVKKGGEGKPELVLMTPDEVVAFVREQALKENAAEEVAEVAGGENDAEA